MNVKQSVEYQLVEAFCKGRLATRSGVPYINHINEGLDVMEFLGHDELAQRAYCLHPLVQNDDDLVTTIQKGLLCDIPKNIVIMVMEYRYIANSYLSGRKIFSIEEIALSPIREVNQMLIADKVQNRKDFELYHLGRHIRSDELVVYFDNWFMRLGISEMLYQILREKMLEPYRVI